MTFCQMAGNNWAMRVASKRMEIARARVTGLARGVMVILLLGADFLPQAAAQAPKPKTLMWDYAVPPSSGILCASAKPADKECIEWFEIAYQVKKGKFKTGATLVARDICVRRKETGGGWTCTAPLPAIPGWKEKTINWAVRAVMASGKKSEYSSPITRDY